MKTTIATWKGAQGSTWTATLIRVEGPHGVAYDMSCGDNGRCNYPYWTDQEAVIACERWLRDVLGYSRLYRQVAGEGTPA